MDNRDTAPLLGAARLMLEHLAVFMPRLLGALLALLLGVLLAWLLRRLVAWSIRKVGLDALLERAGVARLLHAVGYRGGVHAVVGSIAWWSTVLIALYSATEVLGLPGLAEGIGAVVGYLPRLVAASVVLVVGVSGADLLRGAVQRLGGPGGLLEAPSVVGRVLWLGTMLVTGTLAAEQLGLRTDLVEGLILVTAAGAALGGALALALGGRSIFEGLLARHYCERTFAVGDRIQVDDLIGVVEAYGNLVAWLRSEEGGLVAVPSRRLIGSTVRLLETAEDGEAGEPEKEES